MKDVPSSRGYLTMAVGKPRFLEMAVDMALSLREHTSLPIALTSDPELAARSRELYPRVFDEVTLLPSRFRGRARKYGTAETSPFEETMFIDADCIVLGSLDHLWSSLEYSDLAMVGAPLTAQEDENHHGFSTRWLIRRFGLERYMKTNSGLFCFRRSAAIEIMEECMECFLNEAQPKLRRYLVLGRWVGDEIVFGIIGGRRGLRTLSEPFPMYWPVELDALDLTVPGKPLLHFIWPLSTEIVDTLVAGTTARRRAARVQGDAESHWRREVRELARMAKRVRLLERIKLH